LKLLPCKILKEAEISDLPITPSVICLSDAFNFKLEDEERLSRKPNNAKDVSSWKGPELQRVSKVGACKCHFLYKEACP